MLDGKKKATPPSVIGGVATFDKDLVMSSPGLNVNLTDLESQVFDHDYLLGAVSRAVSLIEDSREWLGNADLALKCAVRMIDDGLTACVSSLSDRDDCDCEHCIVDSERVASEAVVRTRRTLNELLELVDNVANVQKLLEAQRLKLIGECDYVTYWGIPQAIATEVQERSNAEGNLLFFDTAHDLVYFVSNELDQSSGAMVLDVPAVADAISAYDRAESDSCNCASGDPDCGHAPDFFSVAVEEIESEYLFPMLIDVKKEVAS